MDASLLAGAEFAGIVRDYVERATAPLLREIADLRSALANLPEPVAPKEIDPADIAAIVQREVAKIPAARDGRDVDMAEVERLIASEVAKIPAPADGRSVSVDDVAPLIAGEVQKAVAALPVAKDGVGVAGAILDRSGALILTLSDGTTRDLGPVVGEPGQPGEKGEKGDRGDPGPRGEQGERGFGLDDFDTAMTDDGRCLLLKFTRGDTTETHEIPLPEGPAGKNGLGFAIRGTYEADAEYKAGDIVALNGGSFVALQDEPGACPGPAWQMWARQGKPGQKGDPGVKGDRGDRGATTRGVGFRVDPERMELSLIYDDGEAVTADLYPIAEVIRSMP